MNDVPHRPPSMETRVYGSNAWSFYGCIGEDDLSITRDKSDVATFKQCTDHAIAPSLFGSF